jgi:hypothetical protein
MFQASVMDKNEIKYLNYLLRLANQPGGEWQGFYQSASEGMNFGLRFQLAFSGYALYGLARRTPAYRTPYAKGLENLIEKMLRPEVWAYWFQGATRNLPVVSGVAVKPNAVEVLHSRLGLASSAISPDPCREGNVQYSGHLASLLGFYELLSGDRRYDDPGFVLRAMARGKLYEFPYTHTTLAARIHEQMAENYFHGVCCEPGRAYAACNNHACISNLLYDQLHGTNYAAVNQNWAEWVREKMLTRSGPLPLPAPNGLLSVAFMPDLHLPVPLSFNLTDAWGLAFMASWQPELVREIYPRFRQRLKPKGDGLRLGSRGPNEKFEISTEAINTGFALLLAREMGDRETAAKLQHYADKHFERTESENEVFYAVKPAPYVTALFALAQALPKEGGGLASLLNWRPDFSQPYLANVSGEDIYVKQAGYETPGIVVKLETRLGSAVKLEFENLNEPLQLQINQVEMSLNSGVGHYNPDSKQLTVEFEPDSAESVIILHQTRLPSA